MNALDVWLYRDVAGRLEQRRAGLRFQYSAGWIAAARPPLSQSLPVREQPYGHDPAHSFFSNLLPEGDVRQLVARRLGVSVGNDFGLLAALGGDCAGAISLHEPGADLPSGDPGRVRWLDDAALARLVAELPARPLLAGADEDGEVRLSLAGAQDKLPVVFRDGRVGIPLAGTPSTHILKAPIERFDHTVVNEAFCLRVAARLGLDTVQADILPVEDKQVLLVRRYDRAERDTGVDRIHQEDFCQALGVPPERKYEAEGGPGFADCFELLRRASSAPAPDVLALMDATVLNFLLGNHDAHGKNFSLLYEPHRVRLAPLYDVVCTSAYPGLTRKMAMKLGGEYRPEYVRSRHVDRFALDAVSGSPRSAAGWRTRRAPSQALWRRSHQTSGETARPHRCWTGCSTSPLLASGS